MYKNEAIKLMPTIIRCATLWSKSRRLWADG